MGIGSSKPKQTHPAVESYAGLKEFRGMKFLEIIDDPNFFYSGYKIHVYSENDEDVSIIIGCIYDLVKQYKCKMKVATNGFFDSVNRGANIQKGKGVTIYLPYPMVSEKKEVTFYHALNGALTDYQQPGKVIHGDTHWGGALHTRYELSVPFEKLPKGGVQQKEYSRLYIPNA